jgi:tripartite-type tricarboxylate transporter receptor subunit TctC
MQDKRLREYDQQLEIDMRRYWLIAGAVLLAATLVSPELAAQRFPLRPVRYILPLPGGQETDVFARLLARRLSETWGQQVLVDNRPGGGTVIGTEIAAKAAPDGYTLLHALSAHAINASFHPRLPYDTLKDFSCITQIVDIPGVLIAHPSLPVKTVKELVSLAKAKPGAIAYATGPIGTANHILGEALRIAAGIDIVHVPYKGLGPANQDLVAGRVPLVVNVVPEALPYIRSGKARPIAITSAKRTASLPAVPTVNETLPGYQPGSAFWALVARSGTPEGLIRQLNADVLAALQATELVSRSAQMDIEVVGSSPSQCDAFLREQVAVWGKTVKLSGARSN